MAKIFYNRLFVGTLTFDAVPENYQESVKAIGKEQVQKGKLSVEHYELLFKEEYVA